MGPYTCLVRSSSQSLGTQQEYVYNILDLRKLAFLKKKHGGRVGFRTHDQQLMSCRRRHMVRFFIVRSATAGKKGYEPKTPTTTQSKPFITIYMAILRVPGSYFLCINMYLVCMHVYTMCKHFLSKIRMFSKCFFRPSRGERGGGGGALMAQCGGPVFFSSSCPPRPSLKPFLYTAFVV